MSDLRSRVVRLAHARPDLRPHLLPILAAGPDLEDMRLRLEALLDEQDRLVEESRAFGVRLAAAVVVPEGTMPFAKMVRVRNDFQKNTEELERYIREFSLSRTPAHLQGEAKALLDRAKAKLAEFKAQRDKAEEAFAAYAEAYQANDLKTLMDDIESWVRRSVGPKIKVERNHKYLLSKGEVLAQLMVERPGVWGPGTTVRVTLKSKAGSPNYLVSLYIYERPRAGEEFRVSKKSRHEVVRIVLDALLDQGFLERSESKSDLLPALRKAMAAVEKGIMSAMTGARTPWSNWDKPHDALDPKGNPAVESQLKLAAGYDFEVTLMMSGAGTFGRVRFRQPAVHNVSYAGRWHTALDLRKTTVQTLVSTATDLILEQNAQRGLGFVKYEPTQGGAVDIDELRRQYTSSAAVYMVEPGVANPRSDIVSPLPVTYKGYAFFGRGVSYHGHSDSYYGQLLKTRSGWVFESDGTKTPVGNNGDLVKLLKMKHAEERRRIDELLLSSN